MHKILILTSKYLPNPSANGINTKYIIDELKYRKNEVTCISIKGFNEQNYDNIDGTHIYRIKPSFYSKITAKESSYKKNIYKRFIFYLIRFLRKIKQVILIFNFPNFDIRQTIRTYNLLEKLYKKNNYDCIIAIFKPYSNIAALKRFKKNYPEVKCIGYYLDLINSMKKPKFMPNRFYEWLCYKEEIETFSLFDLLLMAKGGKNLYSSSKYDIVKNKIEYVDFPTFITPLASSRNTKKVYDDSKIKLIYAGTLNKDYRNPELLLDILNKASLYVGKIELDIYGVNNCEDLFARYINNPYFVINYNGCKSHDEILEIMNEADILINISNRMQNAVPSKIFELFSFGKPIINLLFNKNDITMEYFMKYPSIVNIEAWKSFDENLSNIVNYIKENNGKQFDILEIKKKYIENTPGYTVDIIEKLLNKNT